MDNTNKDTERRLDSIESGITCISRNLNELKDSISDDRTKAAERYQLLHDTVEDVREIKEELKAIRSSLHGNGKKGLLERITAIETKLIVWAGLAGAGASFIITGIGIIVAVIFGGV